MDFQAAAVDLRRAVVVLPPGSNKLEQKAAVVLVEEVEKRTNIRWRVVTEIPGDDAPSIVLGQATTLQNAFLQDQDLLRWIATENERPADGFRIRTISEAGRFLVLIAGNDARGVLFGAGYLLRHLLIINGGVSLPVEMNVTTAPKYTLRGHQLGYRDKTNSYDGWDLAQWDQYIRELAIFGTNAIELIPPRSDDLADSVHFPLPPMDMMEACLEFRMITAWICGSGTRPWTTIIPGLKWWSLL
jgi:hypothetical protein